MRCHTFAAGKAAVAMILWLLATPTRAQDGSWQRSATKHTPIVEGDCGACHLPHSSDYQFMLKDDSFMDLCGDCHEWQSHTTHPIGEEFVDPRNKNVTVQCLSCHRTHGTENKHFLYFSTANEQCVQCHARFRR